MRLINLHLRELDLGRRGDRAAVVKWRRRLARKDRYWVEEPYAAQAVWLDPGQHPERAGVEQAYWLLSGAALDERRPSPWETPQVGDEGVVGSIGVRILERGRLRRGQFFDLHFLNNEEVPALLLDAAWQWLLRRGVSTMVGPVGAYGWGDPGLLVDGFDAVPPFLAPYGPPYYPELLRAAGLEEGEESLMYCLDAAAARPHLDPPRSDRALAVTLPPASLAELLPALDQYALLAGDPLRLLPGAEQAAVIDRLQPYLQSGYVQVLQAGNPPQPAGLAVVLPDMNQVWQRSGGGRGPLARLRAWWLRRRVDRARLWLLGLRAGSNRERQRCLRDLLSGVLVEAAFREFHTLHIGPVDARDEDTAALLQALGAQACGRYRLYRRSRG